MLTPLEFGIDYVTYPERAAQFEIESLTGSPPKNIKQGIFSFSADSDAKVIRGLLVIVLAAFNHKSSEQIMKFDIDLYLKKLGLLAHLSPSRGNGLLAIVDKIKTLAQS